MSASSSDDALQVLVDALTASLRDVSRRRPGAASQVSAPQASTSQPLTSHPSMALAVALSAGADSAMLALAASHFSLATSTPLRFFHVHHGLMDEADEWALNAQALGERLGVPADVVRVDVPRASGAGIEAAAREARYAALATLARQHGIGCILLAHHRDDQAETVMLRLLRGAGLAGLAAMAGQVTHDGVLYRRPWLDIDRQVILSAMGAFSRETGWQPAQDPSNADPRYTRAAVRKLLAPVLQTRWPAWRITLARHARHVAEAIEILDEVAEQDFASLSPSAAGDRFSLANWRALSPARQAHVLRYWLQRQGAPMPSDARLSQWRRSLNGVHALGHDRQLVFDHAGRRIRVVRGVVLIEPKPEIVIDGGSPGDSV